MPRGRRDSGSTYVSPALSQVGELWTAQLGRRSPIQISAGQAVRGGGPPAPAHLSGPCTPLPGHVDTRAGGQVLCPRAPARPPRGRRTCDGVQGRDGEHEGGGEVEVPAQTDVHKEGPCVQVDLREGRGSCAEARGDRRTQGTAHSTCGLSAPWTRRERRPTHTPTGATGRAGGGRGRGRAVVQGMLLI